MTADQLSAAALIGVPSIGALLTLGGLMVMIRQLQAGVKAVHRRLDEEVAELRLRDEKARLAFQDLREELISARLISPHRSPPSRPPLALHPRDEDPTPR